MNEAGVLLGEQTTVEDATYQQQILQHVGETPLAKASSDAAVVAVVVPLPHVSTTHHNAA